MDISQLFEKLQKIRKRPVSDYAVDSGSFSPEKLQIEAIQYEVRIDAAGAITFQTASQRIQNGYYFILNKIAGAAEDPGTTSAQLDKVTFNVINEGRQRNLFRTMMNMSILVGPSGPAHYLEWHTDFRFFSAADIDVTWTVDTTGWTTAKRFYVLLQGELVHETLIPPTMR